MKIRTQTRGAGRGHARDARGRKAADRQGELRFRAAGARPPTIRAFLGDEIVVDNFAGGGGASSGVARAFGRDPDIAINHDPEAIAMHRANHPNTRHYTESVWQVDPVEACGGRPVAFAWFSPDCTHFSKSKGAKPLSRKVRGLAWCATRWAQLVAPRVIALENVEEFLSWGPLHSTHSASCRGEHARPCPAHRRHSAGCGGDVKLKIKCRPECKFRKPIEPDCHHSRPIKARAGETFRAFVRKLEILGYVVEWRLLRACDYGAPTSRRRFFLVARNDGNPIVWPAESHGPGRLAPHRTAAECIDWSIACPSIFDRDRDLADKTLARIARGVRRYVEQAERPFIVPDGNALAAAYLVHRSNGERPGQEPRIYDVEKPLGTIVAGGNKHAVCAAFLAKHHGGNESSSGGQSLERPIDTIATRDQKAVTVAHLMMFNENSIGQSLDQPMHTVMAGAARFAQVAAFLVRYNGTGDAEPVDRPLGTQTTKPRYALATVTIDGETYVIVDIGMRMLTPRELFNAQGFSPDYKIERGAGGEVMTQTAQIRMCGNSVPPPFSEAIARANLPEMARVAA